MVELFRKHTADMIKQTEKISLGVTFPDIFNLCCDLDLEYSNLFFSPQDTQAYDAVLSNQIWLQTDLQFRFCQLLGALSPVNHRGLHQG